MTPSAIDLDTFRRLQETAGADFVADLIATFLEEAPAMLAELRAASSAADAERFRRAAHSLKANGHTFGATKLGALARELELGGLSGSPDGLDALEAEYRRAAAALDRLRHG